MNDIDYDEIVCDVGVLPDGGFDWVCPVCGHEGSLGESDEYDD